jgi:TatD DNase family protein
LAADTLIDIGVNLTDRQFDKDREQVIVGARSAGIDSLIVTGTTLPVSRQALALCQQYPDSLYCTAGVHPHHAADFTDDAVMHLQALAAEAKVVAIGETGLDFNRDFSPRDQQEQAFIQQIELACETGLPLFCHEREAFSRQYPILKSYRDHFSAAVIHCFTGSREELYAWLDLDLHIGITGWVCDERRGYHLHPLLRSIPPDRLMLESDAHWLLPRNMTQKPKKRRNEPAFLGYILDTVARATDKTPALLARETTATARQFFRLEGTGRA